MNEIHSYVPVSLRAFLDSATEDVRRSLYCLSAAVSLTDEVAAGLISSCVNTERASETIVRALRLCDFVVERNSEWHLEPAARQFLLAVVLENDELFESAHNYLLDVCEDADPGHAGDTVPAYLTWPVGVAYHTTVFDSDEGLSIYSRAYGQQRRGEQWLSGVLAEEQQRQGFIPESAWQPAFFQGMNAYWERRWNEAKRYFERVAQTREEHTDVAIALHLLAQILIRESRREPKYADAEVLLRRSLALLEKFEDAHGEAQVLHTLGNLISRNKPTEAEEFLRRSFALLEKFKDAHGEAQVLHSLGNFLSRNKPREAEEFLRRSLALEEEFGRTLGQVQVLHSLGNLLSRDHPTEAEELLRRSLLLAEALEATHHQAQVLHSLGTVLSRDRPIKAEELYRRSFLLGEELGDIHHQAQVLNSLANLYQRQKRHEDAKAMYERVLQTSHHPRDLAIAHQNLAAIAEDVDSDLTSAAAHLAKAIAYQRRTRRRDFLPTMERKLAELTHRLNG